MTSISTLSNRRLKISNRYVDGLEEDIHAIGNMLLVVDPVDDDALSLGDMIGYNDEDTIRTEVARRIKRIADIVATERGITDLQMISIEQVSDQYRVGMAMTYASGIVKIGYINV